MGSDLEAFSRNPTNLKFALLAFQLAACAKYLNDGVNNPTIWASCISMIGIVVVVSVRKQRSKHARMRKQWATQERVYIYT